MNSELRSLFSFTSEDPFLVSISKTTKFRRNGSILNKNPYKTTDNFLYFDRNVRETVKELKNFLLMKENAENFQTLRCGHKSANLDHVELDLVRAKGVAARGVLKRILKEF